MGGFFPINGWLSGWCVIGADACAALPQPRSHFTRNRMPPAIQMALAARSGAPAAGRALSSTTREKIPSMIVKAMKERMIRQRWQVLPRAGLFLDRVITAFLSFPSCPAARSLAPTVVLAPAIQNPCHSQYPNGRGRFNRAFCLHFGLFWRPFVDALSIFVRCRFLTLWKITIKMSEF